jgi:hypothetical protein
MVGRWVLRGTIARQQTVHDVKFEWLLGRGAVPWPAILSRSCSRPRR